MHFLSGATWSSMTNSWTLRCSITTRRHASINEFLERSAMSDAKVVCVLGMHRSGTSLITRMLNFLGVDLGPEEHLLEPAECNPKGFWEHQGFVAINDAVLEQLGGHWDEPPRCSSGWERLPKLNALKTRARSLIQKEFATAQQWGWKDPRTCLTLPFWQDLLPSMHYVLCGREPGS